jgi:anti-anti-sigma factor
MQTVMEIGRVERGGFPELQISGRMDSYWARHVAESIDELMREGAHNVRLNLSKTTYISSAGIRVLVQAFQQLAAVGGTLLVVEPSAPVRDILELAGLSAMMSEATPAAQSQREPSVQIRQEAGCTYEIHDCSPGARLVCRVAGHPKPLISEGFGEKDCEIFHVSRNEIALGLGAFGESYADCRERFGEFLAVAGCAACQPTDETGYADYMLSAGSLVPRMATLYRLSCKGEFGKFLRFDCQPAAGPTGLTNIVTECMKTARAPVAGMVMLAESSGVLGASLKRSPVGSHENLFHHPEVRQWLSFSPMRSHPRSVLLVAGVAAQNPCPPELAPLLRPMKSGSSISGHFHAAVFGYRPLRKGYIEMEPSVEHLFDGGGLQSVLHLVADDRAGSGSGETELTRGACWVGPIAPILSGEK